MGLAWKQAVKRRPDMDIGNRTRDIGDRRRSWRPGLEVDLFSRRFISDLTGEEWYSFPSRDRNELCLRNVELSECIDRFSIRNDNGSSLYSNLVCAW